MRPPRGAAWLAAGALALPLGTAAQPAPLSSATVADFEARLSASDSGTFKRFRPTRAPGADHQCAGNPVPAGGGATDRKNFVAEYADDTPAQVDLALQFEINSDRLQPASRDLLDTLARALNGPTLAAARFAVAGHTDESGPLELNLRLSCARAISTREYLVGRGVDPQRLWAYGFGPRRLLPGQAANSPTHRRVEIRRAPD